MSPLLTIKLLKEIERAHTYVVEVAQDRAQTRHEVVLEKEYGEALTNGKASPEELVKFSFHFLLEREPKEAILKQFNLSLIQEYFPEYEQSAKKHFIG